MRSLVLPLVALIGAGCVGPPGVLTGGGGSSAGGRGGQGGRGGGAVTGVAGSIGTGGFMDSSCGSTDHVAAPLPPEILILLDASGSMNEDASGVTCDQGCGATSKWAETVVAINATVARTETTVNWGLKFFPDVAGACGVAPNTVGVPVAPANAAAIAMALQGRTSANGSLINGGSTPTRSAEYAAVNYLSARTSLNPKFILMATDGLPNCAPSQSGTTVDDAAGTVLSVSVALTAGFPTFVVGVGIGNPTADATLGEMATAGGYPRLASPAYYPVASTAELDVVLRTLVTLAGICTFALPQPPTSDGTTNRGRIGVRVDGVSIPQDFTHTNGWDYTDQTMSTIQLFGPLCAAAMAGDVRTVSILFYCTLV